MPSTLPPALYSLKRQRVNQPWDSLKFGIWIRKQLESNVWFPMSLSRGLQWVSVSRLSASGNPTGTLKQIWKFWAEKPGPTVHCGERSEMHKVALILTQDFHWCQPEGSIWPTPAGMLIAKGLQNESSGNQPNCHC